MERPNFGLAARLAAVLLPAILLGIAVCLPVRVQAAAATSSNYGVSEVRFGTGGTLRACSTTYCAKQSAGELAVGNTKSTNYQAQAGGNTDRQPLLEVTSSGTTIDFGVLDSTTTKAASSTFSVKTYLASGYIVTLDGVPPVNAASGHTLNLMPTPAQSSPGTEQFGVNLRANTIPAIGADPLQVPSNDFSFGAPATAYNSVNYFKFAYNDVIAQSARSSGQTVYTLSMIANIANSTGGGSYKGRLIINVVPSF